MSEQQRVCTAHCGHADDYFWGGKCYFRAELMDRPCGHRCTSEPVSVPEAAPEKLTDASQIPELATDEPHRWEIEPHSIADFDVLVTNDDNEARRAILEIAESYLWDSNTPGEERVMKVRMNDVPPVPEADEVGDAPAERKGLMLCCMLTAQRYGDSRQWLSKREIPKGTTIICDRCKQEIVSNGGQSWSAK